MNGDEYEQRLEEKINELAAEIVRRDEDKEWLEATRWGDTNEYFWWHCGERNIYEGMLTGLKQARRMWRQQNE